MPRLLAIVLAAGPFAASAASGTLIPGSGLVLFNDSTETPFIINLADCASSKTVNLTWTVKPDQSFSDFGGTFEVFVSSDDHAATTPYCYTEADATTTLKVKQLIPVDPAAPLDAPSATMQTLQAVKIADLVSVTAQSTCTSGTAPAYVCVQWLTSAGVVAGYAKGTAQLKLDRPSPPTVTLAKPDDKSIYAWVSAASSGEPAETFRARAVVVGTTTPVYESPETAFGEKARIEGLTNGIDYYVSAVAYSKYGNASDPSPDYKEGDPAPTAIRPMRVLDFWEYYRDGGGRDSGGCQSGAAGLVALVGAAALLRLRRRS